MPKVQKLEVLIKKYKGTNHMNSDKTIGLLSVSAERHLLPLPKSNGGRYFYFIIAHSPFDQASLEFFMEKR